MRWTLENLPKELASLPEPLRVQALEALNDLLEKGVSESEAVSQVRAQSENWVAERSEASLVDKQR